MIPYFPQPELHLGPVTIHAFGVAVAVAIGVGLEMAAKRFSQMGLSAPAGAQLATWILVCGLIGAHLFSVLFYFPNKLAADPWLLIRVWDNISSLGGMLGGIVGAFLYFVIRASAADRLRKWAYLDTVSFVFPITLAIGRFGCTLAHDHVGTVTSFPLAVSLRTEPAQEFIGAVYSDAGLSSLLPPPTALATMGFHDLGIYEFLFLTLVLVPIFFLTARRKRAQGFYLMLFPLLYLPVRFGFDFLRVSDPRYSGLTPAQWAAILVFVMLPFIWTRARANAVNGSAA